MILTKNEESSLCLNVKSFIFRNGHAMLVMLERFLILSILYLMKWQKWCKLMGTDGVTEEPRLTHPAVEWYDYALGH